MPRWKALPDELDPQVREFTGQLRRLVDRSGLSIAAVADRTGYSKTSWERYLGGRLLAPKGAIVALAEVTGTETVHLTTLWELAERAWSRAELRHDLTMEATRISRARAALAEPAAPAGGGVRTTARAGGGATVLPGIAGPAGVSPTIPPQPTAPDANARERGGQARAATGGPAPGSPGEPVRRSGGSPAGGRRLTMFLAGALGMSVVIAGVFLLTGNGRDGKDEGAVRSPSSTSSGSSASSSAAAPRDLPAGVKCAGAGCTGEDAERMGCSGDLVSTARTATVGATVVEVRYSRTCRAAWGRITGAAQGDAVRVSAGARRETATVTQAGDTIAYTPMVAVRGATEARACVTLTSGRRGCTK